MKIPTRVTALNMISVYEWSLAQWSDISLYGPPTRHQYYTQKLDPESREQRMRADCERLAHWQAVLDELS